MAYLDKVKINDTTYDIQDTVLKGEVADLKSALDTNVPSLAKSVGFVETSFQYKTNEAHPSNRNLLLMQVKQGEKYRIGFNSTSSIFIKVYAYYSDGTSENVYQKLNTSGEVQTSELTASKDIIYFGAFVDDAVANGTLIFNATKDGILSDNEEKQKQIDLSIIKETQLYQQTKKIYDNEYKYNPNLIPQNIISWKNGAYNNSNPWIISPINPSNIDIQVQTTFYAFWSGIDFTTYPNMALKIYGFDASDTRIINTAILGSTHSIRSVNIPATCKYIYFAITAEDSNVELPITYLYTNGIRVYFGEEQITTNAEYDALYYAKKRYSYSGSEIDLRKRTGYNIKKLVDITPESTTTIGVPQAFDVYDGKIFQVHQSGYIKIVDINTKEVIGTSNQITFGHGNCCQFAKEKEFTEDIAPVLYVSSWQYPYSIYAIRIKTLSTAEVIRTYRAGTLGQTDSHVNFAIDFDNKIAYEVNYYTNSTSDPTGNYMIIGKYNMDVQISGDGIYWLEEISADRFNLPFFPVMQDNKFIDNKILILSSPGTSGTTTKIYAIDVNKKAIVSVFDDFPANIRDAEIEGLAFYDDGSSENYNIVIGKSAYNCYRLITM